MDFTVPPFTHRTAGTAPAHPAGIAPAHPAGTAPAHPAGTAPAQPVGARARPSSAAGQGPPPQSAARTGELPSLHDALVCVALPCLAISAEHGQLTGQGLEGVYRSGRRLLSRCRLRVFDREPITLQGRMLSADRARFVAAVRTPADPGPDPGVTVERSRDANGTERITLRNATGRPLRLPVELALGTDLAALGAVAAGRPGPELRATVHGSGLRWSAPDGAETVVTADPAPKDALASAGLLRWEMALDAGAARTVELRVHTGRAVRPAARSSGQSLLEARAEGDDSRVVRLLATGLDDLRGLLVRDP
uniref:glycogen debranching N-terminal domain-containing protein n=1 Tax=Streptomyces sp. TRM64462 TaxID=2741726 RepID=UPI002676E8AF